MTFKPQKTEPSKTNKYYIHTSSGGYNRCIHIKNGSCLPNCVGYAWGRWYEVLGFEPNLSRGNAEDWYGNTTDKYKRSQTPKVMAVACWRKGNTHNSKDGCGHVAIVEEVLNDGSIVTSNSAYGGARFYLKTLKPPYTIKGYVFQGFIHFPLTITPYKTGLYKVVCDLLHVRKGAGTQYKKLKYDELTPNAKEQIAKLGKNKPNGYPRDVECSVSQIINNWGRTPSGWICLDYCEFVE